MITEEVFKPLDCNENYEISNLGRVKNVKTNLIRTADVRKDGLRIRLCVNNQVCSPVKIAELVYRHFVGEIPKGFSLYHLNGDKLDCRLDNLSVRNEDFHKLKGEVFKEVVGYPDYKVSNLQRVYSLRSDSIISHYDCRGYVHVSLYDHKRKDHVRISLHRIIYEAFVGAIPESYQIDHINGQRNDNRLENLRCVTASGNNRAFKTSSEDQTSKYRGVCWNGRGWQAQLHTSEQVKYLGTFDDEIEAAKVWNEEAKLNKYLPEALNSIDEDEYRQTVERRKALNPNYKEYVLMSQKEKENRSKKRTRRNSESGFRGVNKVKDKWRSMLIRNGCNYFLGNFEDKNEAISARVAAEKEYEQTGKVTVEKYRKQKK